MTLNYTCPFCYQRFAKSEIMYRCENENSSACRENDPQLAHYFGVSTKTANRVIPNATWTETAQKKSISGFFSKILRQAVVPDSKNCDRCSQPSRKRVCPHCHNELPTNFHKAPSHIISIVGARGSGKTHYITVLIQELLKKGYKVNIMTTPQDVGEDRNQVTSKRYRKEYRDPLFSQHLELPKTQVSARDHYPLIYQISSGAKTKIGQTKFLYLAFYDTAGENFNDRLELKRLANYVTNSSGIIFLLDTFQIPKVNQKLTQKGLSIPQVRTEIIDVFNSLQGLLEAEGKVGFGKKAQMPMAVTFSKIDEVIRYDLLPDDVGSFKVREESNYMNNGVYDPEENSEVNDDMRSLLSHWDQEDFIATLEKVFAKHSYFGVSALGSTPVGGKLQQDIKPHRVLDPLMWILNEINFALPKKS